jgi:hypothetical protein
LFGKRTRFCRKKTIFCRKKTIFCNALLRSFASRNSQRNFFGGGFCECFILLLLLLYHIYSISIMFKLFKNHKGIALAVSCLVLFAFSGITNAQWQGTGTACYTITSPSANPFSCSAALNCAAAPNGNSCDHCMSFDMKNNAALGGCTITEFTIMGPAGQCFSLCAPAGWGNPDVTTCIVTTNNDFNCPNPGQTFNTKHFCCTPGLAPQQTARFCICYPTADGTPKNFVMWEDANFSNCCPHNVSACPATDSNFWIVSF